jgi:hypothetical protein
MSGDIHALHALNFLSRCFDGLFHADAMRTAYWPASCDEGGKSLFVRRANDLKELNLDRFLDADRGTG